MTLTTMRRLTFSITDDGLSEYESQAYNDELDTSVRPVVLAHLAAYATVSFNSLTRCLLVRDVQLERILSNLIEEGLVKAR